MNCLLHSRLGVEGWWRGGREGLNENNFVSLGPLGSQCVVPSPQGSGLRGPLEAKSRNPPTLQDGKDVEIPWLR